MLDVCRRHAAEAGVLELLDLRLGDIADPPVSERVSLVTCPFRRSYLHLTTGPARLSALRAARDLLLPGGRFIFDVFAPYRDDIEETHGRWIEREPGIFERADWDPEERTCSSVRGEAGESTCGSPGSAPTSGARRSRRWASKSSGSTAGSTTGPSRGRRT